jgi:DNA-binding transcriptional ArsR family regulator
MVSLFASEKEYNIFRSMNMIPAKPEKNISQLLYTLGQPTRVKILLAIGEDESCVCHLEALLGQRQPYISQHLMALRKAKILTTRRDGRFIFYRLRNPKLLDLIQMAGEISGVSELMRDVSNQVHDTQTCVCPQCETQASPIAT